ncbi:MAG TPA: GTPase ObgE [Chitinophagaceae bacterium]|nr:MAG: GTPase ObgE [Bacteroidetes bacterium OLB11]HMN32233.1 GTPase ObgE [Chitinophagaceae bacterium]
MQQDNFIDYIRIFCKSGKGGAGSVHFLREKYRPNGGPDGGNGGRGGHIILKGNKNLWTLLHLRYHKNLIAQDGKNGAKNNMSGAYGKDIIIEVPLGTVGKDEETGQIEVEILEHGQEAIWVTGGRGGLGNANFATPTNQAPDYAQPGEPGIEATKIVELKILADVGLVGFPNAGKSTLLSVISAAKPKIADYAFTTITPNLGMIEYKDGRSFCMADLPGIIEGAAEGKGLGHRFLRHIERNPVLLFLIPADSKNHYEEYQILFNELKKYNEELIDKKMMIAISKSDMLDDELKHEIKNEFPSDMPLHFFSSITQTNIHSLKDKLWQLLNEPV